jgi:precorrin-6Y C5,15-methyltransferase (decarboxylating)
MKKVTVVGVGTGLGTLTSEAEKAILDAEVLIGSQGVIEQYKDGSKVTYQCYLHDEITNIIESEAAEAFAILVSGDVGFYSAAAGLSEAFAAYELCFIPGVSTVNAFFAKLKLPWQDAAFVSMHGRKMNIVDTVRRNRSTFCLAGNNINEIGVALTKAGLGHIETFIGENLGQPDEHIVESTAENLSQSDHQSLTVLLFKNEEFDDRVQYGLPNSCFSRKTGVPMTKSETRAVVLSKLRLRPSDICWDIGAGTGSVTVEMALGAYRGQVYAVERREDAIELIEKNCASFHVGNVTIVCGEAPAALQELPAPDAVFIGGSGGNIESIINAVLRKNPKARIVLTAVTLETNSTAFSVLAKAGLNPEAVQLNAAISKKTGDMQLMEAMNPVTIISVSGSQEESFE